MATVTLHGSPLDTVGDLPAVGDTAPAFDLVGNDMAPVKLSDSDGKVRIISVVPSVDTPVCSIQTARFNRDLDALPDSVVGYTISVDTPMAQARWCAAEGVEKMKLLSDFKGNNFGRDWGLYLQGPGLLARSVFVVDQEGKVVYVQLVPEIAQEPDYEPVLAKAKELAA
ncbi:thiol peroxidase [bacterium]|nr:MAG: thiol peroxidase [bacterium]